jgi:hypothetical protein
MILGQLHLAYLGILAVQMGWEAFMSTKLMVGLTNVLTKSWGIFKAWLPILLIALIIYAIYKIWNSELDTMTKIILTFLGIMMIVLLVAILLGVTLTLPGILLLAAIALAIALGIALYNASDEFKLGFLKALSVISKAMFESLIWPIRGLLWMATAIPGEAGKTASKALAMLDKIKSKVGFEGTIADLEAKIAARQEEQAAEPVKEEKSLTQRMSDTASEMVGGITNNFSGDLILPDSTEATDFASGFTSAAADAAQYNASAGTG